MYSSFVNFVSKRECKDFVLLLSSNHSSFHFFSWNIYVHVVYLTIASWEWSPFTVISLLDNDGSWKFLRLGWDSGLIANYIRMLVLSLSLRCRARAWTIVADSLPPPWLRIRWIFYQLVPGRRRGSVPVGWSQLCLPAPPTWRSKGTACLRPSPRISSLLSPFFLQIVRN